MKTLVIASILVVSLISIVTITSGCGKVCIAGIGDCDTRYQHSEIVRPTNRFKLFANPTTVKVKGEVRLTTTTSSTTATTCTLELGKEDGGELSKDVISTVTGSPCTGIYTAPSEVPPSKRVNIKAIESGTGNISQQVLTITE